MAGRRIGEASHPGPVRTRRSARDRFAPGGYLASRREAEERAVVGQFFATLLAGLADCSTGGSHSLTNSRQQPVPKAPRKGKDNAKATATQQDASKTTKKNDIDANDFTEGYRPSRSLIWSDNDVTKGDKRWGSLAWSTEIRTTTQNKSDSHAGVLMPDRDADDSALYHRGGAASPAKTPDIDTDDEDAYTVGSPRPDNVREDAQDDNEIHRHLGPSGPGSGAGPHVQIFDMARDDPEDDEIEFFPQLDYAVLACSSYLRGGSDDPEGPQGQHEDAFMHDNHDQDNILQDDDGPGEDLHYDAFKHGNRARHSVVDTRPSADHDQRDYDFSHYGNSKEFDKHEDVYKHDNHDQGNIQQCDHDDLDEDLHDDVFKHDFHDRGNIDAAGYAATAITGLTPHSWQERLMTATSYAPCHDNGCPPPQGDHATRPEGTSTCSDFAADGGDDDNGGHDTRPLIGPDLEATLSAAPSAAAAAVAPFASC